MESYDKMTKEQFRDMYNIVGAAMEVYNTLGRGMEEAIYQEALQMELDDRGIESRREVWFDMYYKGKKMKKRYKADFVVMGVIVELKSVSVFSSEHRAQLFNYMRLLNHPCGILVNFALKNADIQRFFYDTERKEIIDVYGRVVHSYRR